MDGSRFPKELRYQSEVLAYAVSLSLDLLKRSRGFSLVLLIGRGLARRKEKSREVESQDVYPRRVVVKNFES